MRRNRGYYRISEREFFIIAALFAFAFLLVCLLMTTNRLNEYLLTDENLGRKVRLKIDEEELKKLNEENDSDSLAMDDCKEVLHRLTWNDYDGNAYSGNWKICESAFIRSSKNRQTAYSYIPLIKFDKEFLIETMQMYDRIRKRENLNYRQTAEMIVSSVQSIPYTLIHPGAHSSAIKESAFMKQYHEAPEHLPLNKVGGCLANIDPIGVQSPVEFLYNLKADCDTRTVFLYTILSYFGYDVIVISGPTGPDTYHSMLGINMPGASGLSFRNPANSIKYYIWESTAFYTKKWYPGNDTEIGSYSNFSFAFKPSAWKIDLQTQKL
ncbi:MAG: hypothetical protein KIS94_05090 [Chitinophagales bacterium]|nr:hypothetical protein [Chitinophagales bacterium]